MQNCWRTYPLFQDNTSGVTPVAGNASLRGMTCLRSMPRNWPNARSTKPDDRVTAMHSRSSLGFACQGQAYENRRLEGSHERYRSTRWICYCDCCCLIHQSCLGVLRTSSRAAVSPGPHPITMCYHSGHALATRPPSYVQQGLWSIADRAL